MTKQRITFTLVLTSLWLVGMWLTGSLPKGHSKASPTASPSPIAKGAPIDGSGDRKVPGARPLGGGVPGSAPMQRATPNLSKEELERVAPAPQLKDGWISAGFQVLSSYDYRLDEQGKPLKDARIPAHIQAWNDKNIAVSGFMVPLGLDERGVYEFVLVKNQLLCCYGQVPNMNEWIHVKLKEPAAPTTERPVIVRGLFHVGEEFQDGQLLSIYRLDGVAIEVME